MVSGNNTTIKFYGFKEGKVYSDYVPYEKYKRWLIDFKITNKLPTTLTISGKDFVIEDQFGYQYEGRCRSGILSGVKYDLLPGESARITM